MDEYNRIALEEFVKRNQVKLLLSDLFSAQRDILLDLARRIVITKTRRAGFTYLAVRDLLYKALSGPGFNVGYLTKTRQWAEDLGWTPLKELSAKYDLGVDFNNSKLQATCPNGSIIRLVGADTYDQPESLRGLAWKLVIVDEAGSIKPEILKYVLKQVIAAGLSDYKGQLVLAGTPPPSCEGFFVDVAKDPDKYGYKPYTMNVRDNPMFPRWASKDNWQDLVDDWLEEERRINGLKVTDSEYQREYLGLLVRDEQKFIYELNKEINQLPDSSSNNLPSDLIYVLSIDTGYEDESAFVVLGYSPTTQKVYLVEYLAARQMDFHQLEAEAWRLVGIYYPETIVYDPAAAGKTLSRTLVDELSMRFNLTVEPADKTTKRAYMLLLKTAIRQGNFLMPPGKAYEQMESLRWNKARTREAEGQPADLCDAILYGWRWCYQFLEPDIEDVKPDDMTDAQWQQAQMMKEDLEYLKAQKEEEGEAYDYF